MRMEEGLDTGPVYLERRVRIGERETAGELSDAARRDSAASFSSRRSRASPPDGWFRGRRRGEPTLCRPIRREDALVDWQRPAAEIVRRLRAFTPWPGLYTFLEGERVKILDADERPEGLRRPARHLRTRGGRAPRRRGRRSRRCASRACSVPAESR